MNGICLWPIGIFVKETSKKTLNHEQIHWQQQKEMPFVFYLWYVFEWLINLFKYKNRAYINISFEQEAYYNDQNLSYLSNRKRFAWIEYLNFKPVK